MKVNNDIGKLILGVLSEKKDAVDIDYMAYMTGSTITQVTEEAKKLQDLDLVQMNNMKIKLIESGGKKFSNWDRFKK